MSRNNILLIFILCVKVLLIDSARILVFIPTASFSHQVVVRPLSQELAKRGHEVVVITSDPAFTEQNTPKNLKEIDVHEVAYKTMKHGFGEKATGKSDDIYDQMTSFSKINHNTFEAIVTSDQVQELIKEKKHFDLLILEACVKPVLIFSHIFKAPVILFNSLPNFDSINSYTGAATHPVLFPSFVHQKINNITMWEKLKEIHRHYYFDNIQAGQVTVMGDKMLRRLFGDNIPKISELAKNVDMVFLAEYHFWDSNRPVPPNVVYVGGIYPPEDDTTELSKELQTYLDSSKSGVIYMSFGTNVKTSLLPQDKVDIFLKVLSRLPYDILLRWNVREILGKVSKNIKIVEWVPQSVLLKHPNIKLFITQGGLQSIADALNAGVPIVGLPMLGDQWFNLEQCVRLNIGKKLEVESVTEEIMLEAVKAVIEDDSYRINIQRLQALIRDQPQTALERAVWWSEYVIRNKGASHLRAPTALISNWEYFEGDLVTATVLVVFFLVSLLVVAICGILFLCWMVLKNKGKVKEN